MIYQKAKKLRNEEEDRISRLPDGVIHQILSSFDVRFVVRTSVLSKRWNTIWKTLPYLNFEGFDCSVSHRRRQVVFSESIDCLLRRRNHHSPVLKLNLFFPEFTNLTKTLTEYAISHNVEDLTLVLMTYDHSCYTLSTFNSNSIRKLKLGVCIDQSDQLSELDCWNLPALTTLHLIYPEYERNYKLLSVAFLTHLPALTTLSIDGKGHDFLGTYVPFDLPSLTTLHLTRCNLPRSTWCLPNSVWNLPALLSLELEDVALHDNIDEFFSGLVSLQNLTLSFCTKPMQDLSISCPELINLQIRTRVSTSSNFSGEIIVFAPKLCNFSSVGIFPITFEVSKLENVDVRLRGWTDEVTIREKRLNQYYQRFTSMFPGLGSAKILTLDLEAIQALSAISDFLIQSPSPFNNLEYVKLPQRYIESSKSSALRSYLLGGSPRATVVTTMPQVQMQMQMQEEPMATPSREVVDIHKVCTDTVEGFSGVGPDAPGANADNDQPNSIGGDNEFGLWQGHDVNLEFVSLLDLIAKKCPETFENFSTKSKKLCTLKLNMLCTSVTDFTKIRMNEVNTETITEYRALFTALQNLGFDINWLVTRLDYIEQLRFSQPLLHEFYAIDSRIQDLQSLRAEKMVEIEKAFGTMGTNLVVGNIGDDILCSLNF